MLGLSKLTRAQKKLLRSLSRDLRDRIVDCIAQWEADSEKTFTASSFSTEVKESIKELIRRDAYGGLIWGTLEKAERYNTPYHHAWLAELREQHPDLEVVNKLKTFVRWPVFSQEDIEAAFSDDVEPLE